MSDHLRKSFSVGTGIVRVHLGIAVFLACVALLILSGSEQKLLLFSSASFVYMAFTLFLFSRFSSALVDSRSDAVDDEQKPTASCVSAVSEGVESGSVSFDDERSTQDYSSPEHHLDESERERLEREPSAFAGWSVGMLLFLLKFPALFVLLWFAFRVSREALMVVSGSVVASVFLCLGLYVLSVARER